MIFWDGSVILNVRKKCTQVFPDVEKGMRSGLFKNSIW